MLRVLKKIVPFILFDLQKTVMMALIFSEMDYCNALYLGTSKYLIKKAPISAKCSSKNTTEGP